MIEWIAAKDRLPRSPRTEYGIPVVVWPARNNNHAAFFGGRRYGRRFYWAGAEIDGVTHWAEITPPGDKP